MGHRQDWVCKEVRRFVLRRGAFGLAYAEMGAFARNGIELIGRVGHGLSGVPVVSFVREDRALCERQARGS